MPEVTKEALQEEIKFFEDHQPELGIKYKGKVLLIKGSQVIGSFDTRYKAIVEGGKKFGSESFLVREANPDNIAMTVLNCL